MSTWSYRSQQPAEGAVRVLVGGCPAFVNAVYNALAGDVRFDIVSLATAPDDLRTKAGSFSPEAIVIEASIFSGPDELMGFLNSVSNMPVVCYVILPPDTPANIVSMFMSHKVVGGAWVGTVSFIELAQKIREDVEARRQTKVLDFAFGRWGRTQVIGTQIIGIWNDVGGKGGTTLASNLAYQASRHGISTLLIGLGAPDDLPLIMGLQRSPNILMYKAKPGPEGLRASIQKKDMLDVIAGFPDALSASEIALQQDFVTGLVEQAIYAGYALVVLDIPQQEIAPIAIPACNRIILVSKLTLADLYRTVEAYITITERLVGKHKLTPGNIRIVVNAISPDSFFTPEQWRSTAIQLLRGKPLPAMDFISYDPKVPRSQNEGQMPVMVSDEYRRQIEALLERLGIGVMVKEAKEVKAKQQRETVKVGPLTFKVK